MVNHKLKIDKDLIAVKFIFKMIAWKLSVKGVIKKLWCARHRVAKAT